MIKLVWLLLLSVVLSACGSSTSSVSNSTSGVSVAKSVFNRTESSALQGTASQVIKSSVSGSAIAIYNPANGQVTIPQLQVSGDTSGTTYSVEMMFQGDFLVVTSLVVVGTSTATSATALYYPVTGAVSMPYLTVTGDTSGTQYTVSLQQQGNSMNFSVANVAPLHKLVFTTAMLSGKSFSVDSGVLTFNPDGTLSSIGLNTVNETWAIDSSGQLIIYGSSKGTATCTLISGDVTNGWTIKMEFTNGTIYTIVFVPTSTSIGNNAFTTVMFSGKSFLVDSGTITFNDNGTVSGSGVNAYNETWTINSSGQLVVYNTSKGTGIFTLVSGDATVGWTVSGTYSNGTSNIGTFVPVTAANYTVFDPATNLVWQKNDDNTKRNWNEAVAYCAGLVLNNFNDWRLPSKDELKGLNYSSVFSQINGTYFAQVNDTYIGSYWSNTSFDDSQAYHVFLRANAGSEGYANKSYYYNLVRCVRL